jgi:hypothetical protein
MLSPRENRRSYRLGRPASLPGGAWRTVLLVIVMIFNLPAPVARSDEALLLDGSRQQGELRLREERLEFFLPGQKTPVPWPQLDRVMLAQQALQPMAPPFWWQATLANGDSFACQLIELESNAIICDSIWFQGLRVRRNAIRSLERPLGWAPWLRQEFAKEARGWKETRDGHESPATVSAEGLTLGADVKTLQFTPDSPLPLGKVLLRLKEVMPKPGGRWQLRMGIEDEGTFQPVKIVFGGNELVELQAPGLKSLRQAVQVTDAGTLLQVEIGPAHIHVSANDRLAAWTERGYRAARLRSLSLEPVNAANEPESSAKLMVQEFALARRLEPLPRPPAHPELDEVWLESGDSLFGTYRSLNAQFLELGMASTPRRVLWSQIRGLYPKQLVARDLSLPAPWQLTLSDPSSLEPAHLSGTVRSWSEREVVLIHPLMGELKIPRNQIKSVAPSSLKPAPPQPRKP